LRAEQGGLKAAVDRKQESQDKNGNRALAI